MTFLGVCVPAVPADEVRKGSMQSGEMSMIQIAAKRAGMKQFRLLSKTGPSGRMIVEGFTANLGRGRITGSGHVDFANPKGPHQMKIELRQVDAMAFLHLLQVEVDADVQSKVDALFDLRWAGLTGKDARRTLDGPARWTAQPGYVSNADVLVQAATLTGIEKLKQFPLRSAGASGVFTAGNLHVDSLKLTGDQLEIAGVGNLNAATRDLALDLEMRISSELLNHSASPQLRSAGDLVQKLSGAGTSKQKRKEWPTVALPLAMRGKFENPRFSFGQLNLGQESRK